MSNERIVIHTPLTKDMAAQLTAGDQVLLNGIIYTGRDAAHKKMVEGLTRGEGLPFDIKDQIIFYVGPSPARPGQVIGSAGPTTSGRMDAYAPVLIERGLTGMIGKGYRNDDVISAMKTYGAVYFGATGGAGALISKTILSSQIIAYPELGPEAVHKLEVRDFPVTVVIDSSGNNLYVSGRENFLNTRR